MPNQIHTFWDLITQHRIEIPIIQRDYAQGRDNNETNDIRIGFVNELQKAIAENGETLHLNFVYGKVKGVQNAQQLIRNKEAVQNMLSAVKSYSQTLDLSIDFQLVEQEHNDDGTHYTAFVPLDGQQRLTTLFLLHWYLLKRLSKPNEPNELKELLNFSYKIRPSSKDFCEALINKPLTINDKKGKLSEQIEDANWYFLHWSKDPTVKGMLNMLDTIHSVFNDKDSLVNYWKNLQNGKIRFEFLDLDDFNLTDELYVKMNARGKHLTPFENFKAWLMEYISEQKIDIGIKDWKTFFDTKWADLFWNNKDDDEFSIDQAYINFFRNMFQIFYVQKENFKASDSKQLQIAQKLTDSKGGKYIFLPNQFYKDIEVLQLNLNTIFEIIDFLSDKEFGINWVSKELEVIDFFNEKRTLFKAFVSGSMSYPDKVRFYAMMLFLLKNKGDKYSQTAFVSWMRVVRNLVENTTIDNIPPFARAINSINNLVDNANDIYDYLKGAKRLGGFDGKQTYEEKEKAKLIVAEIINEDSFLNYENHAYFRGKIGFLLELSKEELDENRLEVFEIFGDKAAAIFNYKLKEGGDKEYLLERALLTIDYMEHEDNKPTSYLLHFRQNRWNFVKMTNKNNKKTPTWRDDFLPNCEVFGHFYDLLCWIGGNEIESLRQKINKTINDKNFRPHYWNYHIVHHIENIDYCNQGFIRFNNRHDILLYKESQSNHYHCELFSSGFYETYRKKIEQDEFEISPFNNFWYHEVKSASDTACAVLDDFMRPNENHYAIDISYKNKRYYIKFFNRKEHSEIEPIVKDKLMEIKFSSVYTFKLEKSEGLNKLVITTSGEYGVKMYLDKIFEKLKEL